MRGKIYFNSLLVSFLLLFLHFPAEGVEEALFSKIKMNPIKGDKKAPDFSLKDLNGNKIGIKQFKGKIIFLNFWATWCGPCKEEMPGLEVLHQQFKERNFVLLTVSVDYEGTNPVREFIVNHQ